VLFIVYFCRNTSAFAGASSEKIFYPEEVCNMPDIKNCAKPFVKWAGGKTQVLNEIRAKYPHQFGKKIKKYAEPFVGGGAVLFDILNNFDLEEIYISDINRELICTYDTIRSNLPLLIDTLNAIEAEYLSANNQTRKNIYYKHRENFNSLKAAQDNSTELAALFIFLNRTCFNGLYRVNSKGGYNVPQGSYKNPCICDEENLRKVSEKLQRVNIVHGDYRMAENFIDNETFAYFDPPYRPLSTTANFTAYAQDGFDDNAQAELANFIDRMSERGAYVLASNSDPKNADTNDNFFDNLYAKHKILRIEASRAINSAGSGRGRIRELLIANG
jgi:DNA adenine methylase